MAPEQPAGQAPRRRPRHARQYTIRVETSIFHGVILPLSLLLGNVDNRYELSAATIRRAHQLTITGDEDVEANRGKVVSTSIKQILTKKVKYQIER